MPEDESCSHIRICGQKHTSFSLDGFGSVGEEAYSSQSETSVTLGNELRRVDSDMALSWREVLVHIAGILAIACKQRLYRCVCAAMPIIVLVGVMAKWHCDLYMLRWRRGAPLSVSFIGNLGRVKSTLCNGCRHAASGLGQTDVRATLVNSVVYCQYSRSSAVQLPASRKV